MNILLSAFSFHPGRGSEPGIGWNFAAELARSGNRVTVLTRAHHRESVLASLAADPTLAGIDVRFVGLRTPTSFEALGARVMFQLYYLAWQAVARREAGRLHAERPFDIAHVVTISGVRFPSFLGGLGIPFVIGPLGGGEMAPRRLRHDLPLRDRLAETLRGIANHLARLDPFMSRTFAAADLIFVRTEDTALRIAARHRHKVRRAFGMGIEPASVVPASRCRNRSSAGVFSVLFVARLVSWKGGHLVLPAFARLVKATPEARLTVIGRGPHADRLARMACRLGIADRVTWRHDWVANKELEDIYEEHQVMLFPSLHEAGGSVVLEALAKAMPVVCLDVGGPGEIIGHRCGTAVVTGDASAATVIERLAIALEELARDPELYRQQSKAAWEEAKRRSWQREVDSLYRSLTELTKGLVRPFV